MLIFLTKKLHLLDHSIIFCMLSLPCMISYKMYQKLLISLINGNVMHHFCKSKFMSISLKFCVSQCHNSICIHNKKSCACYTSSISNLFRKIEQRQLFYIIPKMNGCVNRLLRYWTVLSTFQMPLVWNGTSKRYFEVHALACSIHPPPSIFQSIWPKR